MNDINKNILKYLDSKGKIKACLLHKLINHFCSVNSKYRVNKKYLFSCLLSLLSERKIEIIIVEPFDVEWKIDYVRNFTFLKAGRYYVRTFHKFIYPNMENFTNNYYIFDSRGLDFKNKSNREKICNGLLEIIKKNKNIKYKMIIYYPQNSNKLIIHEHLETPFQLSFDAINPPINQIYQGSKLSFKLEKQRSNLSIIKAFRSKYMCFYITLIESIHQVIIKFQEENRNFENNSKKLNESIKKFGYYCINYVNSDWVEIKKSNPYRWETFFRLFKFPFKILNLEFKTIRFYGRTFETANRFKFCIFIKKNHQDVISKLKNRGYEELANISEDKFIAIGLEQEICLPCPSIEHFYFIAKYICYFQLFLLFYHSFEYLKDINPKLRLTSKERNIFEIFFPVIDQLFDVSKEYVSKLLVFKYYTLNSDELEIIYNNILVNNVKLIETKMYKYFLIKHSSCPSLVNSE
ncbi:MAG: hypothetical protein ACFFBP_18260 [Promethearchaeota archaeon]